MAQCLLIFMGIHLKRIYGTSLKAFFLGSVTVILEYLLLMKWMRKGEFFADNYALNVKENKEAAISALQKRKSQIRRKIHQYSIVQKLCSFFDDHPSEEVRISNLEDSQLRHY